MSRFVAGLYNLWHNIVSGILGSSAFYILADNITISGGHKAVFKKPRKARTMFRRL